MAPEKNRIEDWDARVGEIRATRSRIAEKAEDLRRHLKPGELIPPIRRLRENLSEGGDALWESVCEHPVPLALAGLGLGWLILRDVVGGHPGVVRPVERVGEKVGEAAGKVKDAVTAAREGVVTVSKKVTHAAGRGVGKVTDWFSSTIQENPAILAIGALAAGLLAGLTMPTTKKEEETIGNAGEKMAAAALEKGTEALEIGEERPDGGQPPEA